MKTQILATKLNSTTYKDTFLQIQNYLNQENPPAYITVNNVHTVVMAAQNQAYRSILAQSFMALPDGRPLSIVAAWKGDKKMERVFGPTLMEKTIDWGQEYGLKHFFWGSSEATLKKMQKVIKERYPKADIVGMVAPPFRPLTQQENLDFVQQMNAAQADLIWIGLGAPKQERWMAENHKQLNRGLMLGIGAGFDYLAGNTSHAPNWMKKYALEWLYRLVQEPRRLFKRYFTTNSLFIIYLILEKLKLKKFTP